MTLLSLYTCCHIPQVWHGPVDLKQPRILWRIPQIIASQVRRLRGKTFPFNLHTIQTLISYHKICLTIFFFLFFLATLVKITRVINPQLKFDDDTHHKLLTGSSILCLSIHRQPTVHPELDFVKSSLILMTKKEKGEIIHFVDRYLQALRQRYIVKSVC